MGIQSSQPLKSGQTDLSLIKKSYIGTHYRNKVTNQQFLLVQSFQKPQIENGSLIQYIKYHFKQRISLKNKNIPQILEYRDNFGNFCSITCGFSLVMRHPTKSIEQEIVYRREMKQKFGQGQIWNIIYSVLKAMIDYDVLGYNVNLSQENIYISNQGDVIVSDAYLYSSVNLLINPNKLKLATKNIERLIIIINAIMQEEICQGYSPILQKLLFKLSQPQNHNYSKACSQVVLHKCELDQYNQQLASTKTEYINTRQDSEKEYITDDIYERFNQLKMNLAYVSNKIENKAKSSNLVNKASIHPTPVNNDRKPLECISNSKRAQTVPNVSNPKWIELSNYQNTQNSKQVNSQQFFLICEPSQTQQKVILQKRQGLKGKNKYFLQNLIKKQPSIILQVTDSDLQQSSLNSRNQSRQQSRNVSFHPSLNNLNSVNQLEETVENL